MSKKHVAITVIVGVMAFVVGFFAGDSSAINRVNKNIDKSVKQTSNFPNSTPVENPSVESKQEDKIYKIGDTLKIGDKYTLTINKIFLTKERNQFSEQKVEKVAVIEYTYKNLNNDEDLFISDIDFKVYDEEGNALETYPAGANKMPQNIAKGKQCTAEMAFGFNKGNKLELHYYDNMFSSNADAKFIVEVK